MTWLLRFECWLRGYHLSGVVRRRDHPWETFKIECYHCGKQDP